jgi:hypothetical protein
MSKIFISYHRRSQAVADSLVRDLEAMGHTAWFDQELAGGQSWWSRILAMIREADVFLLVLDADSLNSTACKREYGYAADVGKAVVPVLTGDGVSINLLPPALSQIQIVDYRNSDRDGLLRLAKSLTTLPPAGPLPDPLPPAPAVPLSYLGTLTEQIDQAAVLSYEAQSALIVDLRANARDPETRADAITLLRRLRKRRDLFASIGDEIDDIVKADAGPPPPLPAPAPRARAPLSDAGPLPPRSVPIAAQPVATIPVAASVPRRNGLRARLMAAAVASLAGALFVGFAVAVSATESTRSGGGSYAIPLVYGAVPWGVAGLMTGTRTLAVKTAAMVALAGLLVAWVVVAQEWDEEIFLGAAVIGGGPGSLVGAILGVVRCRRQRQASSAGPQHS